MSFFANNRQNITEDLADILRLVDKVAGETGGTVDLNYGDLIFTYNGSTLGSARVVMKNGSNTIDLSSIQGGGSGTAVVDHNLIATCNVLLTDYDGSDQPSQTEMITVTFHANY